MLSILKPTAKIASPNQSQPDGQNFLSELMETVDDSSPDDTGEMLRLKMAKSVEWCDKKLSESMSLASQYEFQETMMIVIQLYDDKDRPIPTCQWLRNGFRFESVSSPLLMKQELLLINHAIAAYLQLMQNVPLGSQRSAAALPYIPPGARSSVSRSFQQQIRIEPLFSLHPEVFPGRYSIRRSAHPTCGNISSSGICTETG